jgi:hypothetical protein
MLAFLAGAHTLVGLHDMSDVVCSVCEAIVKVFVFLRELRG